MWHGDSGWVEMMHYIVLTLIYAGLFLVAVPGIACVYGEWPPWWFYGGILVDAVIGALLTALAA